MALRNSETATPEAIQDLAEQNLVMAKRIAELENILGSTLDARNCAMTRVSELEAVLRDVLRYGNSHTMECHGHRFSPNRNGNKCICFFEKARAALGEK